MVSFLFTFALSKLKYYSFRVHSDVLVQFVVLDVK